MADNTAQKVYLFKGDKYVQIDAPTGRIDVAPTAIAADWTGLKDVGFDADLDAAVYFNDTLVFFKGTQYAVFDPKTKTCAPVGPISATNGSSGKGPAFGTNLPNDAKGDFTRDIDAAIMYGSGELYFLKGAYCCRAAPPAANLKDAPTSFGASSWTIASDWKLPYPYSEGVEAAFWFSPVQSDYLFFRGNSWTTYDTQLSQTIESQWPGLRQYGCDDRLDAAVLVPWAIR